MSLVLSMKFCGISKHMQKVAHTPIQSSGRTSAFSAVVEPSDTEKWNLEQGQAGK